VIRSPSADHLPSATVIVEEVYKVASDRAGDQVIVAGVSFGAPLGSFFAISGPSGSGKSILLNIVTGLDRPTSGRVTVAGRLTTTMSEYELARWRRQSIGVVSQFFHLLPALTAQENVLLALELGKIVPRADRHERALECLRLVDMDRRAARLPRELSRGEQQRVAIARALANDPPILVADEPTGNLDSRAGSDVMTLLRELTDPGKTVLYATHDPDNASLATDHIDLRDGRVVDRSYGALPGLYV
jgi:putative ABC transport system ATP-binding protein